jgi:anaphase-promoting complex subunit 6
MVGTYYFHCKKYEIARKYFQKAIMLDKSFVYAWIGMAHSFAVQDESDQAMSIYRTIVRLFPGCAQAHLYMGMEYLRTNNLKTATLSLMKAKEISQTDPLIYSEIGVIKYKQKDYLGAKEEQLKALALCQPEVSFWVTETILTNLSHSYRKLKDYSSAIKYLEQCVSLNSSNPQTYFSLAFVYHLNKELNKAICYYHKSLKYKHDNQFAQEMLQKALSDAS